MFKTKLSILLLASIFIVTCTKNVSQKDLPKFSIDYIEGEYDGLILKNTLTRGLHGLNYLDQNSAFLIQSAIKHSTNLFITNIDNTSDREKISSSLAVRIIHKNNECEIYENSFQASQFYIFALSNNFLSNQVAVNKIKQINTESVVRQFLNKLKYIDLVCND
jgi:hypothetical protein